MKKKLRQSFLPYCDVYLSETASQTRADVGRGFILDCGIDWMVAVCYWLISCE